MTDDLLAQLRERERELSNLLNNLPGIVYRCSIGLPWRMSFIGERVFAVTGYEAGRFADGSLDWLQIVHPDDVDRIGAEAGRAIEAGAPFQLTYRIRCRNGRVKWVREHGNAVRDENGVPSFLEGYIEDCTEAKETERALQLSEKRLGTVLHNAHAGIMHRSAEGELLFVNDRFCAILGRTAEELARISYTQYTHPDDLAKAERLLAEARQSATPCVVRKRYIDKGGRAKWCEVAVSYVYDDEGNATSSIVIAHDIDQQIATANALKERERRLSHAIDAAELGILEIDIATGQPTCSEPLLELFGLPAGPVTATALFKRLVPEERRRLRRRRRTFSHHLRSSRPEEDALRFRETVRILDGTEHRWLSCVGRLIPGEGAAGRVVMSFRDITAEIEANDKISWIANHDGLTGLPNRRSFTFALEGRIEEQRGSARAFALILLDLDNFKDVNDTLGHAAGDLLLQEIGNRLKSVAGPSTTIARLGGDEFGILMDCSHGGNEASALCARIAQALEQPVLLESGLAIGARASMGISISPAHALDGTTLFKNADIALYEAKRSGRAAFRTFDRTMSQKVESRSSMILQARNALEGEQVLAFYQPKYCLQSRRIVGFEALLRWRDRHGRIRLPADIAPAFDHEKLSLSVSEAILRRIAGDIAAWNNAGVPFGHVAINVSATDIRRGDFPDRLAGAIAGTNVRPSQLQVEVTENVFLQHRSPRVDSALFALSSKGIKICLDDFGTGYASLRHLRDVPVDVIKLDKSFVGEIERPGRNHALVDAIINISRALDLELVAEGIETAKQEEYLRNAGCKYGQGYLFSKAVEASAVPGLLRAQAAP